MDPDRNIASGLKLYGLNANPFNVECYSYTVTGLSLMQVLSGFNVSPVCFYC